MKGRDVPNVLGNVSLNSERKKKGELRRAASGTTHVNPKKRVENGERGRYSKRKIFDPQNEGEGIQKRKKDSERMKKRKVGERTLEKKGDHSFRK